LPGQRDRLPCLIGALSTSQGRAGSRGCGISRIEDGPSARPQVAALKAEPTLRPPL